MISAIAPPHNFLRWSLDGLRFYRPPLGSRSLPVVVLGFFFFLPRLFWGVPQMFRRISSGFPVASRRLFQRFTWFPKQCLHHGVLACLRLVKLCRDSPPPGHSRTRKSLENNEFINFFKKEWSWRSSFGVYHVSFCRMIELICLFLLQNTLGSLVTPWGLLGSPWDPFGTPLGPLGIHPWIRSMDLIYGSDRIIDF